MRPAALGDAVIAEAETAYQRKLKDPRWQRRRLEILERDKWTCQMCFDTKTTLHVHHRWYRWGMEPWEYGGDALVTLCACCHKQVSQEWKVAQPELVETFKREFSAIDTRFIVDAIDYRLSITAAPRDIFGAITEVLMNDDLYEHAMKIRQERGGGFPESYSEETEEIDRAISGGSD